ALPGSARSGVGLHLREGPPDAREFGVPVGGPTSAQTGPPLEGSGSDQAHSGTFGAVTPMLPDRGYSRVGAAPIRPGSVFPAGVVERRPIRARRRPDRRSPRPLRTAAWRGTAHRSP